MPATKDKPLTKTELLNQISEDTGLAKTDVNAVFASLEQVCQRQLKKGPGVLTIPGLLKIKKIRKPAQKARKGTNPFTGEPTTFKAKPARNVIKVQALKKLKEMV